MENSTPLNDARPDIVDCGSIATHCPPPWGREEREARVVGGRWESHYKAETGEGDAPPPRQPLPAWRYPLESRARVVRSRTTGISVLKVASNDCRNMRGFAEPEHAKTEDSSKAGVEAPQARVAAN